jgi:uracil-DNA glycosylase family 4
MGAEAEPAEHLCTGSADPSRFLQRGSGRGAGVLVVGESPAPNGWRRSGRAFYTPRGRLLPTGRRLNELLSAVDVTVDGCGFTELVKCFTGRRPRAACARGCWPALEAQVRLLRPRLVLLLGRGAYRLLSGVIDDCPPFGVVTTVSIGGHRSAFLAVFHPSPVSPTGAARNREIFRAALPDLVRVLA